jgi:aspartate kinase
VIVMKFGGTSVEDAPAIARVAEIVYARREDGPVVVVSALARVTDQLLACGKLTTAGDRQSAFALAHELRVRHRRTASELLPRDHFSGLQRKLEEYFHLLQELLARIAALQELSPCNQDYLLSFGELLSSEIISAAFAARGLDSAWVDARECVVTDDCHTRALPLFEHTNAQLCARLLPLFEQHRIPVMGGFIGATREGVTTTVGRGGSDYSASIVGAALGAERIEIWTDVPGLMTTDPSLCPDAHLIPEISFEEAAEIATVGAKVLHPATLLPAIEKNIPVCVLNSRDPKGTGTCIRTHAPANGHPVRAIAAKRGMAIVNVTGEQAWMPHGFLRSVLAVFDEHNCPVEIVSSSQVRISLAVEADSALPELISELESFARVTCEPQQALVSVVGENLRGRKGIAAKVFASVAHAGVNVRMISQGVSELNISFVIEESDVPAAVRQLHADLFGAVRRQSPWRLLRSRAAKKQAAAESVVRLRVEEG